MIWNASGEMGKKLISVNYKIYFYGLKKEVVELLQPLFIVSHTNKPPAMQVCPQ